MVQGIGLTETLERAAQRLREGRGVEAEALLAETWQSGVDSARAWFLAGVARHMQLRPEAALAAMERALAIDPDLDEARRAAATLLLGLKRPHAALAQIEELLHRRPAETDFLVDAGIVLEACARDEEAEARYAEVLRRIPHDFRARLNRGALLLRHGKFEAALNDNRLLAKYYAGSAVAFANLGENLLALHSFSEAETAYSRALALEPDRHTARMGRGVALSMLRKFEQAKAEFEKVHHADPAAARRYLETAGLAGGWPVGGVPETGPRLIFIHGALLEQESCNWQRRRELIDEVSKLIADPAAPEIHDRSLVFNALALPLDQEQQRNLARLAVKPVSAASTAAVVSSSRRDRLRVGYLSPDFRAHPAARIHWRQMALHDRERFEVIALSLHAGDGSPERTRIMSSCDRFVELSGLDSEAAALRVALERIDILVGLAGHTDHARPEILVSHIAPIQVQHLGMPGPCGGSHIDYRLTDAVMTPPDVADRWDEKLVWLPDTCWVCDETVAMAARPSRTNCGLPENAFVFCCFNRHFKIEPDIFAVWMRLLHAIPESVLWLIGDSPASMANLRREAQSAGVRPERLVFAPRLALPEHLARHGCADLFLDTLYCNAHTTASDALLAGLPVLTLPGSTMAARFCASLVLAAGLPELVAADLRDYEEKALRLAREPLLLQGIRQRLPHDRMAMKLFDMPRRTREIERAYETMWARHAAGLPPESFMVSSE